MTEQNKGQELPRTQITKDKVLFGEKELTNLCWTLIKIFRYKNSNQDPKAIVFPDVKEVGGVRIEYPKETIREETIGYSKEETPTKPKSRPGKISGTDS